MVVVGDTKVTLQYRGCSGGIVSDGCHTASTSDLKGITGKLLKTFSPKMSGKVCYCGSDLCDPRCDGVMIGDDWYATLSLRCSAYILPGAKHFLRMRE